MSTVWALGSSTIRLSPAWNAFCYWLAWAVCLAGIGVVA
jgi:hypothetical protein